MTAANRQELEQTLKQQDEVIALMTRYMDDLLDRARAVNATQKTRPEAGAFALYVEQRLADLVGRVAEVGRELGREIK